MQELTVTKFKDGSIVRESSTDETKASVMVVSKTLQVGKGGTPYFQTRRGFMRGDKAVINALALNEGENLNAKLSSLGAPALKLVVREQTKAFYEGQEAKVYGATHEKQGEVVKDVNGSPIYRETFLVHDIAEEQDILVKSSTAVDASTTTNKATVEQGDIS